MTVPIDLMASIGVAVALIILVVACWAAREVGKARDDARRARIAATSAAEEARRAGNLLYELRSRPTQVLPTIAELRGRLRPGGEPR